MQITGYDLAQRYVGLREVAGTAAHPAILAMLRLDAAEIADDETPWCSAFVNHIAWLLRLPRSKSLRARSWLTVGVPVGIGEATSGFDVVVLNRATGSPEPILDGPGHVGWFASLDRLEGRVYVLGGNQGDAVSVAPFPASRILGVRRLWVP